MVEARTLGGGVGGRGERENLQKDGFIFPLDSESLKTLYRWRSKIIEHWMSLETFIPFQPPPRICTSLLSNFYHIFGHRDQNRCVDRSHSETCTDCILRQLKLKMYRNTQACDFIKGEMFWYLIKDGESEDMGTKTFFFFFWGGGNLKKNGFIFPSDSESLKTLC